jgi:Tfp pilus assembly protein PilX
MVEGLVTRMRRKLSTIAVRARRPRRGAAMMVCLFIIFVVTVLVVNILDTETVELAALRNSIAYEKALYLANAGVHHAAAELENLSTWRGTVTDGSYPADNTYTAAAVDGSNNTVVITARGSAGGVIRTVMATIEL